MKTKYVSTESATDRAARERERALASENAAQAATNDAAGLTSDLRAIYGMRGLTGARWQAPAPVKQPTSAGPLTTQTFAGTGIGPGALASPQAFGHMVGALTKATNMVFAGVTPKIWDMITVGRPK